MKSAYQIIRRPVITEKGLGVKETEATLVFEVAVKASKTEIKQAVQSIFKVKVDSRPLWAKNVAAASSPAIVLTGKRPMCG
jgi:large subunit ribosomal protein L23